MYQIGMTSAARSAPVGRETRGTARRWGRETRPPRRWVTNRYPVHSMLPNSSATYCNAILFLLVANVFGRGFPNVWGLCTPHTWGHPNTTQLFLLIYIRLFLHCNFAVYSGIFRYSQHFCSCTNSGYNCRIIHSVRQNNTFCISPFVTRLFSSYLFAINFNSANLAELKIFHRRLPHTCVVGCGGFVVGLEQNPPHIYERIFDYLLHLSVFVVSVVGFAGKVLYEKIEKMKRIERFLKQSKPTTTHHSRHSWQ